MAKTKNEVSQKARKPFWQKEGFWQQFVLLTLSFVLPILVMLGILGARGFYPFGDKTLFIMDMKGQYLEFFASLRNLAGGDDSLFFSWSRSMGGNYLGLFAYYVASPLSFLTIFFPLKNMPAAIMLLTLLKIGLCGLSFAWYGSWLWRKYAESVPAQDGTASHAGILSWTSLILVVFAVSYALISYNMVYSLCLMWLDGVILLPLILLGVEKILDGERGLFYILALAALFICNYYTGYMAGVFTAIYLIYRVVSLIGKDSVKTYFFRTLRFAGGTFLAFGLSAPLILPVVKDLMQGKLSSAGYVPDTKTNFVFSALFGKFKNGVYDSITNSGLPAVYCGYLVILLLLAFFVLTGISVREKIGAALILALLAGSFYYTKWDIAWHGFQYPTWFPYRYAFVASFFMIYMACRSACALWSLVWRLTAGKAEKEKGAPRKAGKKAQVREERRLSEVKYSAAALGIAAVLTLVVCVDLAVNGKELFKGLETEFGYGTVEEYEAFLNKTQPLAEQVREQDDSFYRINQGFEYSKNDAMLLGYHGMTHYSSTYNAAVNSLTPKLGIAQSHFWNSGYGSNPMLDSLFAVKYILEDGMVPACYESAASTESSAAYSNPSALGIAYSAPVANANPDLGSVDPYVNQNAYLNAIAGTQENYFTPLEYSAEEQEAGWSYTFTADSDNPVYLYMKSDNVISWADVYVDEAWVGNYFSTETSCSLYLGSFRKGQQVVVRVAPSGAIPVNYAVINQLHMELLRPAMEKLQQGGMEIRKHRGGKLSGTITVGEGEKVMTSIPWDSGWTVKIDGRKTEAKKYADTFLMVDAEPGEHEISFSYRSPGFGTGLLLFAAAAVILSAPLLFSRVRKADREKK